MQLGLTSLVMTAVLYPVASWALPATIHIQGVPGVVTPLTCFFCIISGLWGGCIIGFITEYYTSHSYQPVRIFSQLPTWQMPAGNAYKRLDETQVRDVARSTETGAATNIIYGLALGYQVIRASDSHMKADS